jgi:hypothetical protein
MACFPILFTLSPVVSAGWCSIQGAGISPWGASTDEVVRKRSVRWLSDFFKNDG